MHHRLGRIYDLHPALGVRAHYIRVIDPLRATSALCCNFADRWELDCFRLERNEEPSQEKFNILTEKFARWLREAFVNGRPKLTFLDMEESNYGLPQTL